MKTRKVPMRRCIGCMESKPKGQLIRIACYEGKLTVDPTGRAKGRGVYLCPTESCMALARKKKSMQRNFGIAFEPEELERIYGELDELRQEDR